MSIQNGGATVGITDPAAEVGTSGRNPSSCGAFGCGVYDIATATPMVTSVTMDFGYAGTGTSGDIFSQILGVTPANPSIALNKSVSPSVATKTGTTVTYSYLVTNTGNTTLDNVHPADTAFSGTGTPSPITCPSSTLDPGQDMTCTSTSTYTLTKADAKAGKVINTATATGSPPGMSPVTSSPSSAAVTIVAGRACHHHRKDRACDNHRQDRAAGNACRCRDHDPLLLPGPHHRERDAGRRQGHRQACLL